jgi:hypothetical protein
VIMNPPIITLSPVSTRSRVEMFSARAGVDDGVALGVEVGVAVAAGVVAVGVAVGVAVAAGVVAVGVTVAVGVAVGVAVAAGVVAVGVAVGVTVAVGVAVAVAVGVAVAVAVGVAVAVAVGVAVGVGDGGVGVGVVGWQPMLSATIMLSMRQPVPAPLQSVARRKRRRTFWPSADGGKWRNSSW